MRGTIQFDINFYSPNSASILFKKDILGGKLANDYGELLLLSCFVLRHVTNIGYTDLGSVSLANNLPTTYEEVLRIQQQINIIPPQGKNKSKTIRGSLFFDREKEKLTFRLHLKGFGLFRRHARQYVEPSVVVIIAYLVQLHKEERPFLLKLAMTCALCRDAILNREITSREHVRLAAQIATRSISEYNIFDIWNKDELVDIWVQWQAHKVPSSYEEKCYEFFQTVITNFDDVLAFSSVNFFL